MLTINNSNHVVVEENVEVNIPYSVLLLQSLAASFGDLVDAAHTVVTGHLVDGPGVHVKVHKAPGEGNKTVSNAFAVQDSDEHSIALTAADSSLDSGLELLLCWSELLGLDMMCAGGPGTVQRNPTVGANFGLGVMHVNFMNQGRLSELFDINKFTTNKFGYYDGVMIESCVYNVWNVGVECCPPYHIRTKWNVQWQSFTGVKWTYYESTAYGIGDLDSSKKIQTKNWDKQYSHEWKRLLWSQSKAYVFPATVHAQDGKYFWVDLVHGIRCISVPSNRRGSDDMMRGEYVNVDASQMVGQKFNNLSTGGKYEIKDGSNYWSDRGIRDYGYSMVINMELLVINAQIHGSVLPADAIPLSDAVAFIKSEDIHCPIDPMRSWETRSSSHNNQISDGQGIDLVAGISAAQGIALTYQKVSNLPGWASFLESIISTGVSMIPIVGPLLAFGMDKITDYVDNYGGEEKDFFTTSDLKGLFGAGWDSLSEDQKNKLKKGAWNTAKSMVLVKKGKYKVN